MESKMAADYWNDPLWFLFCAYNPVFDYFFVFIMLFSNKCTWG